LCQRSANAVAASYFRDASSSRSPPCSGAADPALSLPMKTQVCQLGEATLRLGCSRRR